MISNIPSSHAGWEIYPIMRKFLFFLLIINTLSKVVQLFSSDKNVMTDFGEIMTTQSLGITSQLMPVTLGRRWSTPTDASAVMAAHQFLSSVMRSNDEIQ